MLLIFPPVAKPSEPPAGIARLAGVLQSAGIPCRLLDGNVEGLLWLMTHPSLAVTGDIWTTRAVKDRERNLSALRDLRTYHSPGRYVKAVSDLNRLLAGAGREYHVTAGLADYQHYVLSPLRSGDLLIAAQHPEQNPFFSWFSERLPEMLEGIRTVGFSLSFLSQALCGFAMIGYIRRHFPAVSVVLGGGLVTSWLKRPGWSNPFGSLVDRLVAGPGEQALLELCCRGRVPAASGPPDYSQLPLSDYLSPGFILPYSASSGCWWNGCSFCPERAEGNVYRPLPTGQVIRELQLLTDTGKPSLIHFLDNAVSPALLRGLAERGPGIPWYGFTRFEKTLEDPVFCRALRASGCVMLKIGLESGDQMVLDRLCKGIDLGAASRILNNLADAGIATYLYLLFGTPAETVAAARRTLEFVVRHRETVGFLNLALFNMPAYGDEAEAVSVEPFYEGDLSFYTGFRHPRGWDRGEARRFLNREFKREPSIAAILRRDPPYFTSNHAPFFAGMDGVTPSYQGQQGNSVRNGFS